MFEGIDQLTEGKRVAITKKDGTRIAGLVESVFLASRAQGLRYKVTAPHRKPLVVEAVDVAEIIFLG